MSFLIDAQIKLLRFIDSLYCKSQSSCAPSNKGFKTKRSLCSESTILVRDSPIQDIIDVI